MYPLGVCRGGRGCRYVSGHSVNTRFTVENNGEIRCKFRNALVYLKISLFFHCLPPFPLRESSLGCSQDLMCKEPFTASVTKIKHHQKDISIANDPFNRCILRKQVCRKKYCFDVTCWLVPFRGCFLPPK